MTEINQEEMQQELFIEFADAAKKPERFIPQNKVNQPILLNTSVEQLILIGITMILVCCFVFFLGVLRGKSLRQTAMTPAPQKKITSAKPAYMADQPSGNVMKLPETIAIAKPYTIQVSTYRKPSLAEKEAAALRSNGYAASVISDESFAAVCIGQYATKEDAKKDLNLFGAKFKGSFLRRH